MFGHLMPSSSILMSMNFKMRTLATAFRERKWHKKKRMRNNKEFS